MTYVSLEFKLSIEKKDDLKILLNLMRKQSSAIKIAYNMLKDGSKKHSEIYQKLRKTFLNLPTKYLDSAIYKAKQYPLDKTVAKRKSYSYRRLKENR